MLGGGKLEKQVAAGAASATPAPTPDPDAPDVTIVLGRDLAATFAERSAKR